MKSGIRIIRHMLGVDRVEEAVAERRGCESEDSRSAWYGLCEKKQAEADESFKEPYRQWFKTDFQNPTASDAIVAKIAGRAK